MAGVGMKSLACAVAVASILLLSGHWARAEDCSGDLMKLGAACKDFVLKPGPQKDPSPECCDIVKQADIPCVCSSIPKGVEDIISMEKIVYVSKYCGKPLKSGTKCGDYTIPASLIFARA